MHNLFSGKNRKNITNLSPESGKGYKPTFQIDSLTALDVFFFVCFFLTKTYWNWPVILSFIFDNNPCPTE